MSLVNRYLSHENQVIIVVCLGVFLFFNSLGSINVTIPTIQREFHSSLAQTQWITIIGVVMLSTFSLCFGKASGYLGRKRLFIIGVTMYSIGAGLAATSNSFWMLLFFRGVMTFGLSVAAPMGPAILAISFPAHKRGQVLGYYASALAVGQATGPTTGGLILSAWGWHAVFLSNLILGSVVAVLVFLVLRGKEEAIAESFDFKGAAFLIAGYPAFLVALSLGNSQGWTSAGVLTLFAVGAIGLIAFVLTELRVENPLIRLAYFKNYAFTVAMVSLVATSMVWQPINFFAPLYISNVLGLGAVGLGLMISALPISTFFASPISGRLSDRFDAGRYMVALGLLIALMGAFTYSRLGIDPNYGFVILALALVGLGYGLFTPANQKLAFSAVPISEYGLIAGMLASFGTAVGTIGTTIAVAIAEDNLQGRRVLDPVGFAHSQETAITLLLPAILVGLLVAISGIRRTGADRIAHSAPAAAAQDAD